MKQLKRVGINALFFEPGVGGVGVYARQLLPELVSVLPSTQFEIFLNPKGKALLEAEPWAAGVKLTAYPLLSIRGIRPLTELALLGPLVDRRRLDLLHSLVMFAPLLMKTPRVVSILDTIWLSYSDPDRPWTMPLWRTAIPKVAKRAERVLTISHVSAKLIAERLAIDPAKIDVSVLGPGSTFKKPTPEAIKRVASRYQLPVGKTILTVAQKRPHKNLIRLIHALAHVVKRVPEAKLVLVGPPTVHDEELKKLAQQLNIEQSVLLLSFVPQEELEALYACASCFVLPSLEEGFGLPVLEAQARSVPVACSRDTALAEVVGDSALLFDPYSEISISEAILDLCASELMRDEFAKRGLDNQAGFSWRRAAEETVECYQRTLYAAAKR